MKAIPTTSPDRYITGFDALNIPLSDGTSAIRRRFEEAAAVILYDMRVLGMPEARALVGASRYEFEAEILPRYGVSTTIPSDEGAGAGMPVRRPG